MSDLTADQEALRQELIQAMCDAKYDDGSGVTQSDVARQRIANAVLPIVTRREAALRERLELAEENTAEGADEAVRQAQTMAFTAQRNLAAIEIERDQLVKKINTLADAVREYQSAICWETTCLNCSKLLDRCYADTQRAETAEESLSSLRDAVARLADQLDAKVRPAKDAAQRAHAIGWPCEEAKYAREAQTFEFSARRLRSLLPQAPSEEVHT